MRRSATQVIVYTDYPGQAPEVAEDQVTYPLTTAMLYVIQAARARGQVCRVFPCATRSRRVQAFCRIINCAKSYLWGAVSRR
jgi:hypothetical protein